jgi:hypothetical protein
MQILKTTFKYVEITAKLFSENETLVSSVFVLWINPLNTKRRLLYFKTQFVPRSKHFSSLL